jgi:hypothetical protein
VALTVVDRFLKFAHFITLSHPYSAPSVAKAFFEGVVRLHGFPCLIVSDRDPMFTSAFWAKLFKLAGARLHTSSAFHPQFDGQSEVVNCVITMYLPQSDGQLAVVNCVITMHLRCLAGDRLKSWLRWLSWAEYCYNSSFQSALKCSPFRVVYSREPPTLLSYQPGTTRVAAVDMQLQE